MSESGFAKSEGIPMGYDVLIVHGSFGDPFGNWQPWLFQEATKLGKRVLCPHFPGPDEQSLESWTRTLDSYRNYLSADLIVFAHSLGPAFVLDYCVQNSVIIRKFVGIVPFYDLIGIDEFDKINASFFVPDLNLARFQELCPDRNSIYSDNDPYVPRSHCERLTELIDAKAKVVSGGGHLNAAAGFTEFPLLLDYID